MHKQKKTKSNQLLDNMTIKRVINKEFKNHQLQKYFKDVQIYSNLKTLEKNINRELDLSLHGQSVAIPIINKFIKFKNGINYKNINSINKKYNIRSLYVTDNNDYLNINGINALDVNYASLIDSINWGQSFEKFLVSKELKVTKWIDPIEQLICCMRLSEIFDCYFDLYHHTKAAATLLYMDDELLEKFKIKRSIFEKKKHTYLEENLIDKKVKNILFNHMHQNEYKFSKNQGYPYIYSFLKTLPKELDHFLYSAINVFSPQTKKDFLNKFKKADYVSRLMMLIFNKKDLPLEIINGFKEIYKFFNDKEILINEIKAITYDEFEIAIRNYIKITKDVNKKNVQIKKLFSKGIFKELINFKTGSEGPLIKHAIGFIPKFNNLIEETIEFKDYQIKQVKSLQELISVGKEFSNCLKNYENYHQALKLKGLLYIVFRYQSKKTNYGSFVAYINIKNKNFEILEMKRKRNAHCSNEERFILQEFLINKELIDIPEEFFGQFMQQQLTEIAKKDFEEGIKTIIDDAGIIYSILKRLRNNRYWFNNDINITDGVKTLVLDALRKQEGMKKLQTD